MLKKDFYPTESASEDLIDNFMLGEEKTSISDVDTLSEELNEEPTEQQAAHPGDGSTEEVENLFSASEASVDTISESGFDFVISKVEDFALVPSGTVSVKIAPLTYEFSQLTPATNRSFIHFPSTVKYVMGYGAVLNFNFSQDKTVQNLPLINQTNAKFEGLTINLTVAGDFLPGDGFKGFCLFQYTVGLHLNKCKVVVFTNNDFWTISKRIALFGRGSTSLSYAYNCVIENCEISWTDAGSADNTNNSFFEPMDATSTSYNTFQECANIKISKSRITINAEANASQQGLLRCFLSLRNLGDPNFFSSRVDRENTTSHIVISDNTFYLQYFAYSLGTFIELANSSNTAVSRYKTSFFFERNLIQTGTSQPSNTDVFIDLSSYPGKASIAENLIYVKSKFPKYFVKGCLSDTTSVIGNRGDGPQCSLVEMCKIQNCLNVQRNYLGDKGGVLSIMRFENSYSGMMVSTTYKCSNTPNGGWNMGQAGPDAP